MHVTSRLYYTDPSLRAFEARVIGVVATSRGGTVYLDRTAFYPEGGGQPADRGFLGDCAVVDVQEEADGRVGHLVEGHLEVGATVRGVIDWARRFDHMQQHTGQHVLSAAFARLHGVGTESFHLGAEVSTIDLAREVTAREVADAESLANEVIWEDRPVTTRFVDEDEAARLPLRKPPVRQGRLRIVEVADFDFSACGGTHVSRTGGIGLVVVRGWERYKGGTRLFFLCGGRALRHLRSLRSVVDAAVRVLSVTPEELPDAVTRLQAQHKALVRERDEVQGRLATHEGEKLAREAQPVGSGSVKAVLAAVPEGDGGWVKRVATAAAMAESTVAILVSAGPPPVIVAARHPALASCDCSALVRAICAEFGGRGGGRPELAQAGGMTGRPDDWLQRARAWIASVVG